jgi:hypothetical protein
MVRTKEFFTLPSGFFFGMVAPLHLEELDSFALGDTVFLIQDLDQMLGYVKSASSGATSGNTTSTGAFKHFFSYDMWKIS